MRFSAAGPPGRPGGNSRRRPRTTWQAVHLQPKSPEANLHLGLVLVTMKKTALGRRYLERTVELDPTGDAGAKARQLLEATPAS